MKRRMKNESIWAEGSFTQTMSSEDMQEKMKTFHMKHDEDVNYDCRQCNTKISAHQRDWHDCLCEICFNKTHYPDSQERQTSLGQAT